MPRLHLWRQCERKQCSCASVIGQNISYRPPPIARAEEPCLDHRCECFEKTSAIAHDLKKSCCGVYNFGLPQSASLLRKSLPHITYWNTFCASSTVDWKSNESFDQFGAKLSRSQCDKVTKSGRCASSVGSQNLPSDQETEKQKDHMWSNDPMWLQEMIRSDQSDPINQSEPMSSKVIRWTKEIQSEPERSNDARWQKQMNTPKKNDARTHMHRLNPQPLLQIVQATSRKNGEHTRVLPDYTAGVAPLMRWPFP